MSSSDVGIYIGDYRLHGILGSGGMATVYLASVRGLGGSDKKVALKVMHRHISQDPSFRKLFFKEARIGAALHHPNVVMQLASGEAGDTCFLALEYLRCTTLAQLMRLSHHIRQRIPMTAVLEVLLAILRGLEHAHRAADGNGVPFNVIHRDLKPGNVLLGAEGEIKLSDFGVAWMEGGTSQHTELRGTTRYMAPEQASELDLDQRVDLYAVGVTAFELLAGEPLIPPGSQVQILQKVVEANHEGKLAALEKDPERGEVVSLLRTALQREPGRRFQTAHEMRRAFEQRRIDFQVGPSLQDWLEEIQFDWEAATRLSPLSSSQLSTVAGHSQATSAPETEVRGAASTTVSASSSIFPPNYEGSSPTRYRTADGSNGTSDDSGRHSPRQTNAGGTSETPVVQPPSPPPMQEGSVKRNFPQIAASGFLLVLLAGVLVYWMEQRRAVQQEVLVRPETASSKPTDAESKEPQLSPGPSTVISASQASGAPPKSAGSPQVSAEGPQGAAPPVEARQSPVKTRPAIAQPEPSSLEQQQAEPPPLTVVAPTKSARPPASATLILSARPDNASNRLLVNGRIMESWKPQVSSGKAEIEVQFKDIAPLKRVVTLAPDQELRCIAKAETGTIRCEGD